MWSVFIPREREVFYFFPTNSEDRHTTNMHHRSPFCPCARPRTDREIYRVRRDCEGGPNAKRNSSWFYFGVAGGSANQIITMVKRRARSNMQSDRVVRREREGCLIYRIELCALRSRPSVSTRKGRQAPAHTAVFHS